MNYKQPNATEYKKEFAIAATFLQSANSLPMHGIYLLNKCTNWKEFKNACENIHELSLNITYADVVGNIGYHMTGHVPLRTSKAMSQINFPIDGTAGDCEWQGMIPPADRPHCLNPECGYVISCNHKIVTKSYPYYVSNSFKHARRATRVRDLLEAKIKEKKKLTLEDHKQIQLDIVDCHPEYISKYVQLLQGQDLAALHAKCANPNAIPQGILRQVFFYIF